MINIDKINTTQRPYIIFKELYLKTLGRSQKNINAIAVSSFNSKTKIVDSRFVNLKYINDEDWIFFTNLESPKAKQFRSFDQISVVLFWSSTNIQIRIKAKIKKTSKEIDNSHFLTRSKEKNALAISSNQSRQIDSFDAVKDNFEKSLKNDDLKKCPNYWGGFAFTPYEIEFWQGNEFRLNKRDFYKKDGNTWNHFILQP